jgi:uncharacterized protein with FMN-binding domain
MNKKLKTMSLIITAIILGLVIGVLLFINLSSQFGGSLSKQQQEFYAKSKNYKDGKFINQSNINLDMSISDIGKSLVKYINPPKGTQPEKTVQVQKIDSLNLTQHNEKRNYFGLDILHF